MSAPIFAPHPQIPNWSEVGNEPMTKREIIAALMMQAQVQAKEGWHAEDAASKAVSFADALIAELKRRKEPQQ